MNKNGFTLIEIIICLVLIVGIGVGSVFGIITINNNLVVKELSQIKDRVFQSVETYIEVKKQANEQIYNKNNAAVIPLSVLQNEGLIDFNDLNIKNHYVISLLGGSTPEDACLGTTSIGSWEIDKDDNKVIYLCTDVDYESIIQLKINELDLDNTYVKKGDFNTAIAEINTKITDIYNKINSINSNINTINNRIDNLDDPTLKDSNYSKATRTRYYYRGSGAKNYIKLEGTNTTYRILYIDTDDSLVLYSNDSFGNTFENSNTLPLSTSRLKYLPQTNRNSTTECRNSNICPEDYLGAERKYVVCNAATQLPPSNHSNQIDTYQHTATAVGTTTQGETYIGVTDVINSIACNGVTTDSNSFMNTFISLNSVNRYSYTSAFHSDGCYLYFWGPYNSHGNNYPGRWIITCGTGKTNHNFNDYKIRLKPCYKISTGSGTSADPFILKNTCNS